MWNMGMKIDFRDKILDWDGDKIQLKIDGALQDKCVCSMLYIMHLDLPILKEAEKRVEKSWILYDMAKVTDSYWASMARMRASASCPGWRASSPAWTGSPGSLRNM